MDDLLTDSENEALAKQKQICVAHGADFLPSLFDSIIGVALETFENLKDPINGLRHSIEKENVTGWYIWAGEYSSAADFFKPVHVKHLIDIHPKVIDYLGLAPGWRFLFDDKYEDIWHDEKLIINFMS